MTTKNYQELVKDRIYIGGADNVEDMMENEIEEAEEMAKTVRSKISVKPEMKESLKRIFPNA
jgi:pyruvate formate-lyase activating enzyme-like uncharacterized protein